MGHAVCAEAQRLRERARVSLIRLHAPAAGGVHRGVVRVGHDHGMAEPFEMLRDPLALR